MIRILSDANSDELLLVEIAKKNLKIKENRRKTEKNRDQCIVHKLFITTDMPKILKEKSE